MQGAEQTAGGVGAHDLVDFQTRHSDRELLDIAFVSIPHGIDRVNEKAFTGGKADRRDRKHER